MEVILKRIILKNNILLLKVFQNFFFKKKSLYEIIVSNGNVVQTTVADSMEVNYFYELPELAKNTIEDYFANNFDNNLKEIVEQIINNIENPNEVYRILKEIWSFL